MEVSLKIYQPKLKKCLCFKSRMYLRFLKYDDEVHKISLTDLPFGPL